MQLKTILTKPALISAIATIAFLQLGAQQQAPDSASQNQAVKQDTIIIERKAQQDPHAVTIKGNIIDAATRKPAAGINVSVTGYSAAISDENGRFTLKVPSSTTTLMVSAEGYQSKNVPLQGNKEVTIQLYDDNLDSYYDPAVVTSGQKPKNRITSSVVSLNLQGAWTHSTETPDNILQGNAPGLTVIRKSGTPNIGSSLFMRGMNSLYATNKPLVIVDGMIYENIDFGASLINNFSNNALSLTDIKDIDNITVIKDGSSLYGTKGANGVIMISTAKARQLATRIDFGVFTGVNFAPEKIPVMSSAEYRPYLVDMLQSQGLTSDQIQKQPYMTDDINSPQYYRYHNNTNWQHEIFQNSMSNNIYLKVAGGDNIARYALSMGYLKNQGVIKNTSVQRYNTRFNADMDLSKRLLVNANLSFAYAEQMAQNMGINAKLNPLYVALVKAPFLGLHEVNEKGIESPNLADVDTLGVSNPSILVNNVLGINKSYRFFGSLKFNYTINPLFTISSLFGLTNDKVRENFFIPRKGIVNDTLQTAIADSRSGSQVKRLFGVFNDTRVTYANTFNKIHAVEAQAGFRFQQQNQEQDYGFGFNSATDELVNVGFGIAALRQVGGDIGTNRWLNTYLNVNYGFNEKLFLNVDVAADASSRFGKAISTAPAISGVKVAILPSISAAWLISSEKFMNPFKAVSYLKLRAGFGYSGNDDIGNFTARQYYVSQNLLGMQGLVRGNIANPYLQWELSKKGSLGLDMGFWHDRIRMSVDVYNNQTSKMVVMEQTISATGFNYVATNSGGMKNQGIEVSVNSRIINKYNLKWDAGFSIATYKNRITRLPNDRILTEYAGATILTETGRAANLFYGYKTHGVYSSDEAAAAEGYSTKVNNSTWVPFKGGDVRFEDVNKDNHIDEKDMQVIGNPNPDFTGSFSSSVTFKRFTLDALFTFSAGNDIYNYMRYKLESGSDYNNQLPGMNNRWRTAGQVTNVPKAVWGDPMQNSRFSDRWIEDGSYLRLRSISLTYNVPVKPAFIKYLTVYGAASNLITFSKYLGYDPEFSSTESVFGQGIDIGLEPQYRSVQAGVRMGL